MAANWESGSAKREGSPGTRRSGTPTTAHRGLEVLANNTESLLESIPRRASSNNNLPCLSLVGFGGVY